MLDLSKLTWTCHVCGDERPDAQISVAKFHARPRRVAIGFNVRHCNDRAQCAAGAEAVAQRWADNAGFGPVYPGAPLTTQEDLDRLNQGTGFQTPLLRRPLE
jgi:hypothetical protein